MKPFSATIGKILAVIALGTMSACGGGGGGGTSQTAGVSVGVIENKSSVVVNGVTFSTTGATIRLDDNPGTETELKRGMVVTVRGTSDDRTGTATVIEFDDNLQGPITPGSINTTTKTFTVLGKTVKFEDNATRVNDDSAKIFTDAGFTDNKMVTISGFEDNTGAIRATRIDDSPSATEIEVKGFVSAVPNNNAFPLSLTLGGATAFTVNFTSPLPAGVELGAFVEVRGTIAGSVITALNTVRGVTLEDDGINNNEPKVEVEGLVASGTSASFVVNGITVTTSGLTEFENGLPSDLIANVKVEVEGPMVNGVLQAVKVSFRSNVRIQGLVTAVTGNDLTVLGKTVKTSQNTDFRPFSGNATSIASIIANITRVEARGYLDITGNLVATRVDLTNDNKDIIMSPVSAEAGTTSITLLFGGTVTVNGQTQFSIDNDDVNDQVINVSQFFNLVNPATPTAPGTVVKARLVSGSFVAEQLEIEGDR